MNSPLVSVGIITYNHEKFIRQCLEGVMMQQTNFPFEVIIGEDCSTDNTRKIIEEYTERYPGIIKPIYQEVNVGGARNAYEFCYPKLTGKYIAMCEGDDFWTDPLKLQKQVDFLEKNPDCVMCFHRINRVNEKGEIIAKREPSTEIKYLSEKELFHISVPTLAIMFRNCIKEIPKEIIDAQCGDAFIRGMLASHGRAANLGFIGAHYRIHPGGFYSSKNSVEQFLFSLNARKQMIRSPYFNKSQKKEIRKEYIERKLSYLLHFIRKKEFLNFFKILST